MKTKLAVANLLPMASPPPNVLFILADDMGPWALGCAGNPEIRTPHLDALAADGLRYEQFFCASPVCSPARATLLTGNMPSQHGVHDWIAGGNTHTSWEYASGGKTIRYLAAQTGYPEVLSGAGYATALVGKWHLGDAHLPQMGFNHWEVHAKGGGPYYNAPMVEGDSIVPAPGYLTQHLTERALAWLEQQSHNTDPFYLALHYTAPHSPWGREQHPPEFFDPYFDHCPFSSIPGISDPPQWVRGVNIPVPDEQTRRTCLSGYFAAVSAMDEQIGRLLRWLDSRGLRKRTLVIFTSDNGMCMGQHGVFGKGNATSPVNFFEESVKVPFIVSHPGSIPAGGTCSSLRSQYDVLPTLLDYLGLATAQSRFPKCPGRSFAHELRSPKPESRDEPVYVFDEYGPARMVRTRRWKWIRRYLDGTNELYDLQADPTESRNLAALHEYADIRRCLDQQLEAFFNALDLLPERDGRNQNARGFGQVGLSGEARSFLEEHPEK